MVSRPIFFKIKGLNKNGVLWSQARKRIEMRLRCYLVIGNLQLVIGNRQSAINNWSLSEGNGKKTFGNWTDQSDCSVSGQSGVSRQTRMSGQTRIS